mgnify:CR=1 FL=1
MAKIDKAPDGAAAEARPWGEWAQQKGHVITPQRATITSPRRNPNRGKPDVRVVRAFYGWPIGKLMTEAEYDGAVEHVYHGPIYS